MSWTKIVDNVARKLNEYKPIGLVEANGAQDAIYEQILAKINYNKNQVQPFTTTTKTKPIIIEDLIVSFEQQETTILGEEFQLGELDVFTYEYNVRTRKVKYEAPTGLHDDYVMSKAICNHAFKTMKTKGQYYIR